jgi:hypothetical protein
MSASYCFCSRVSVRRVARVLQTPRRCASHNEAPTTIACGRKERPR